MANNFAIQFLIALALAVAGYLLTPKPKQPGRPSVDEIQTPTAEAGRPIPICFGDNRIKGVNVLWGGDKFVGRRKVKV